MCPVSCKLQNLSIKLFSGSVSEPLVPDPCVFPPQHSAIPSVSSEPRITCWTAHLASLLIYLKKLSQELGRAAFLFVVVKYLFVVCAYDSSNGSLTRTALERNPYTCFTLWWWRGCLRKQEKGTLDNLR